MKPKKISIDKNTFLIAYKLLYDLLLLLLLTFTAVLAAEGLLPGLISSKISFSNLTIAILLVLMLIAYLGKNMNITYERAKMNRSKILPVFVFFSFLLIGNSLLKFTLWENITITITTLFTFFLIYEIIFTPENK